MGGRSLRSVALLAGLGLALSGCGGSDDAFSEGGSGSGSAASGSASAAAGGEVVVGSAGFTEIQLLAEMYSALLADAGYETSIQVVENREIYEPALERGEIDVVPEYAATMAEFLNRQVNGPDAEVRATNDAAETVEVINELGEPLGIAALEPAAAVNQNAFVVSSQFAEENDLTTLSDLGALEEPVVLAATTECPERPFCEPGLEGTYGIEVSQVLPLGFGTVQTKEAVSSGDAQLGLVGTTDGTLEDFGLTVLEDDQGLQLADNLVPVVGQDYLDDEQLASTLNELATVLSTEDLAALNAQVDSERQQPAEVARTYLEEQGLL